MEPTILESNTPMVWIMEPKGGYYIILYYTMLICIILYSNALYRVDYRALTRIHFWDPPTARPGRAMSAQATGLRGPHLNCCGDA